VWDSVGARERECVCVCVREREEECVCVCEWTAFGILLKKRCSKFSQNHPLPYNLNVECCARVMTLSFKWSAGLPHNLEILVGNMFTLFFTKGV